MTSGATCQIIASTLLAASGNDNKSSESVMIVDSLTIYRCRPILSRPPYVPSHVDEYRRRETFLTFPYPITTLSYFKIYAAFLDSYM